MPTFRSFNIPEGCYGEETLACLFAYPVTINQTKVTSKREFVGATDKQQPHNKQQTTTRCL